jgi:RNA polymerase sigma factor (sigma-70 family)
MSDITNCENLANAIILQAVKDYRMALKCLRANPKNRTARADKDEIDRFFRSQWFMVLTSVDGEMLIRSLNMEVERMTAKGYLNQARHLDALINCRLREIDYWRDLSRSVSGCSLEPHYNPNRPTEAPFVKCLEKIDMIQRDVEEKVAYLIQHKEEINTAIDMLASRDEQLLLRYRYLDDFTWEEIARMLNVSLRTVHRIHGSALQNFSVPD